MKFFTKYFLFVSGWGVLAIALTVYSCESKPQDQQGPDYSDQLLDFPSFVTPVEKYFKTSISGPPAIGIDSYQLKISGAVNNPATYSLEELKKLEMIERTLTIECIGNPVNGDLVSNATWKGFRLYDLLISLGIKEGASTVKYICADGYYTYNTIQELQNADVMGALYMNEEPIPEAHGFPLRILFPGYYGVRQPGWVVEIELLESGPEDYWTRSGWKSDTSMTIDSKIFFPANNAKFTLGDSVKIGGAAYGSRRISAVDISIDDGKTWIQATIKQDLDEDYIWIFWEVILIPQSTGPLVIRSRATALDGSVQPRVDNQYLDGTNSWPTVNISVENGG